MESQVSALINPDLGAMDLGMSNEVLGMASIDLSLGAQKPRHVH